MMRPTYQEFHHAMRRRNPSAWSVALATRACQGSWPRDIRVPNAVDDGHDVLLAAVYAMACGAQEGARARIPRRVWWIVHRTPIQHAVLGVATELAEALESATTGPLRWMADRLRAYGGREEPLGVAVFDGGKWRGAGLNEFPAQPLVIATTLDDAGGALLFRPPGVPQSQASILAGLLAHDSLLLLEHHSSTTAFRQTLERIAELRRSWPCPCPVPGPFWFSTIGWEEEAGSNQETGTAGRACTTIASGRDDGTGTSLVESLAEWVGERFAHWRCIDGEQREFRMAVVMNGTSFAATVAECLRANLGSGCEVDFLASTMRLWERERIVASWAEGTRRNGRRRILVLDASVEAGLPVRVDVLLSEASEFSREFRRRRTLLGLGWRESGSRTTAFRMDGPRRREFDAADSRIFGAMTESTAALGARRPNAPPTLMPAHLDLLAQTWPFPVPSPDVGFFIRGDSTRGAVVWMVPRADLDAVSEQDLAAAPVHPWVNVLSLTPPSDGEGYPVSWAHFRCCVQRGNGVTGRSGVPFVIWRGIEASEVTVDPDKVHPHDTVVLRAQSTPPDLYPLLGGRGHQEGYAPLDIAEPAASRGGVRPYLRLHPAVLEAWIGGADAAEWIRRTDAHGIDGRFDLEETLKELLAEHASRDESGGPDTGPRRGWWYGQLRAFLETGFRCERHPLRGWILVGKAVASAGGLPEFDFLTDDDDLDSWAEEPRTLRDHATSVAAVVRRGAGLCLEPEQGEAMARAAFGHDRGKADPRYQSYLRAGVGLVDDSSPVWVAAPSLPRLAEWRQEAREIAKLPGGIRHEALSLLRLPVSADAVDDGRWQEAEDLTWHLVACHHGRARPLLPPATCRDGARRTGDLFRYIGGGFPSPSQSPSDPAMAPGQTAVAERYWRLTRRHGWWGLAYLEAAFRLGDREALRARGRPWGALDRMADEPNGGSPSLGTGIAFPTREEGDRWVLDSLSGTNPLGFLAAAGVLRVLDGCLSDHRVRLSWFEGPRGWRPMLHLDRPIPCEVWIEALLSGCLPWERMFTPELLAAASAVGRGDRLCFPVAAWREFCRQATGRTAEYAAAWAVETAEEGSRSQPTARRTRFDFTAGKQCFLRMARRLKETTTPRDLARALAGPWTYEACGISFRWDPVDEKRQYALQASDPQNSRVNPSKAASPLHLLGLAALPLFPMVPDAAGSQVGFSDGGDGTGFQWPIWKAPISVDTLRSLLSVPWDNRHACPPRRRSEWGVSAVFQSAVVQPGAHYRCFTPARAI